MDKEEIERTKEWVSFVMGVVLGSFIGTILANAIGAIVKALL